MSIDVTRSIGRVEEVNQVGIRGVTQVCVEILEGIRVYPFPYKSPRVLCVIHHQFNAGRR